MTGFPLAAAAYRRSSGVGAIHPSWPRHTNHRHLVGRKGWLGPAISLAVLVAALSQLRTLDLHQALALVPATPWFWLALFGAYAALPFSEWLIYRRLWGLPATGILPLLRKRISNEILLGYSGELYFYAWARRHTELATAPFGVIKDVAILSAQIGNLVTLVLVALAWPLLGAIHLGEHGRELMASSTLVVALSLPAMLFRRRLLSLPAPELWRIAGLNLLRILAGLGFAALMWHDALPSVAFGTWLVLAALRQLLSRLPLMPNKDIAFAGLAVWLVGAGTNIAAMIAMIASLILALHVAFGTVLALVELLAPTEAD